MILPDHIREVFAKATCLHARRVVEAAIEKMAQEISHKLADSNPIFLCVVVGGIVPLGNLLPHLDFPLEVDYVHATRYGADIVGKELIWKMEPSCDMRDRTVIVVDDILDGGITLARIIDYCQRQGARAVHSAVLVEKQDARLPEGLPVADFTGLHVENLYVFGYGMDYKGYLRNAPGIYAIADEHG